MTNGSNRLDRIEELLQQSIFNGEGTPTIDERSDVLVGFPIADQIKHSSRGVLGLHILFQLLNGNTPARRYKVSARPEYRF